MEAWGYSTDFPKFIKLVNGKNEKNRAKIEKYLTKHNIHNVINLGFVNNINELMSASDIAFARGGGAGISECFYSFNWW